MCLRPRTYCQGPFPRMADTNSPPVCIATTKSFSSWDNSRIASGGADKIVFLTDVGTGQPIRKLRGHLSVSGYNATSVIIFMVMLVKYWILVLCRE